MRSQRPPPAFRSISRTRYPRGIAKTRPPPEDGWRSSCTDSSVQPYRSSRCVVVGDGHEEGAMRVRQVIVIGIVLLAAACGSPQSTPGPQTPAPTTAAEPSPAVQLGGPPTGAGTTTADTGAIKPAD